MARPTIIELVEAVREFLETDVAQSVHGRTAFHTRVAVNVLKIVQRELEQGTDLQAQELERLQDLLGAEGSLEELRKRLCAQIREGAMDSANASLKEHLKKTTMGQVSVDNPLYSGYLAALEKERALGERAG